MSSLWNPKSLASTTKTSWSSSQVTSSTTSRTGMRYTPSALGAWTLNVKVPTAPGGTIGSTVVTVRLSASQPTDIAAFANWIESFFTPRSTWLAEPRSHDTRPALRNRTVTLAAAPGASVTRAGRSTTEL